MDKVAPICYCFPSIVGAIFEKRGRPNGLQLEPSTWSQMLQTPCEELSMIADGAFKLPTMNIIEFTAEWPIRFEIIYLKAAVRRDPRWGSAFLPGQTYCSDISRYQVG